MGVFAITRSLYVLRYCKLYVLISSLFMKQEKQGNHGYIPRIYAPQLYDVRLENQLNLLAHEYEDPEFSSRQNEGSLERKCCRPQRLLQ